MLCHPGGREAKLCVAAFFELPTRRTQNMDEIVDPHGVRALELKETSHDLVGFAADREEAIKTVQISGEIAEGENERSTRSQNVVSAEEELVDISLRGQMSKGVAH